MAKDVQDATKGVDVDARKEALQIAVGVAFSTCPPLEPNLLLGTDSMEAPLPTMSISIRA